MMNTFLNIQITNTPEDVKFYSPIQTYIKEHYPNVVSYDFDNHSELHIIAYATKLISDSNNTIIFIDTDADSNVSKLMPFLTNLLDNPSGVKIILKGNHTRIDKMISILPHLKIQENTYEIGEIVQFFAKIF